MHVCDTLIGYVCVGYVCVSAERVAAKARGVRFGRPPKLAAEQSALDERRVDEGTSVREAAMLLKCHHATLYRTLSAPAA